MESTNSISNEVAAAVIADKCRADQDFARRMQADGKAALSSLSAEGVLADDLSISVVRNAPGQVHVVLPDYAFQKGGAQSLLTDEQMADIAGGEIILAVIGIFAGTLGVFTAAGLAVSFAVDE